jgi:aminoglycoside 6'-N-acetyltransferase I
VSAACWTVRAASHADRAAWAQLRAALWPDEDAQTLLREIPPMLADADRLANFVAVADDETLIGFAEASLRRDPVNGTDTSPVGFLEGWYVMPAWRRRGVGRALVAAVEQWTLAQGCGELASDTWLDHDDSRRGHLACGFEETERVICFRKRLGT